ncbi:Type IV pilus biogenesis protein PilQ [Janthinobacterium sp. CG23_2]|nr:Type IV pilus biogenesis protein PilQ [Janthinobacterium sp. CG23_2]CUU30023.1 Type IV pilus biogenesis protein PilQ [Janthinobacterium sp. CG23_2]
MPLQLSVPADNGRRAAPNYQALPAAQLSAGASDIAQVLGSTASGTLTIAYTLTYLRVSELHALIADVSTPLLERETSSVVADPRSNTLLLKGTPAEHQLVENLIRRLDKPVRQVLLEVKIVSADDFFGKSLGARFGITSSHMLSVANPRHSGVQVGATSADLNTIANSGGSAFPAMVSLPATNSLTAGIPSTLAVGFYKLPAGINIGVEISALEEAGHSTVLSNPKLVLSNARPGILSSGQRIPYSRPSIVQGVTTTEFIDAKVSIAVTALVSPDGLITMDLALTDDSVGAVSAVGPTINTNQVTSNVTLRSGETLVLGGFKSAVQSDEKEKTPWIGDLPLLGRLFKRQATTSVKRELMFVITPTIIDAGG